MTRRARSGYTMVSVLIVLGIILLAFGFLLPGLMKMRGASSKMTCMNNLRQIGIAVNNYASAYNDKLPNLVYSGAVDEKFSAQFTATIHFAILPYMEHEALYRAGLRDTSVNANAAPNPYTPHGEIVANGAKVSQTVVKAYLCPEDKSSINGLCANGSPFGQDQNRAGTSYSANYMLFGQNYENIGPDEKEIVPSTTENPTGAHSALYKIGNIPDGTTNTIMFTERLITMQATFGSLWAYPNFDQPKESKSYSPASFYNPFIGMGSVNGKSVGVFAANSGWANYALAPQVNIGQDAFDPSRAGSAHPDSVFVVMGDASVRTVSGKVSSKTWSHVLCPDDNQVLGDDW